MKIAILDDYQDAVKKLACFQLLNGHDVKVYTHTVKGVGQLSSRLKDVEALVLIRERTRITPALLDALPQLKLISQTGKVAGHINVADCSMRGIAVAEGAGDPTAPAELAWALLMAAMRRLPQYIEQLKLGNWQSVGNQTPQLPARTSLGEVLKGKTLVVWSYGKIGRLIAGYGRAFGMRVLVWGREASRAQALAEGYAVAASKEEALAQADVLSLHLRLNDLTRGIVTAQDLARMKPSALLVNTSRAELVAEGALLHALQAGAPGFAALDVFESEPVLEGMHNPLLKLANVIATPHLGYVENDSYELYLGRAFENIVAFANGAPQNLANPEVLAK